MKAPARRVRGSLGVVVTLLGVASGCVSFREHLATRPGPWPPVASGAKKSVSVSVVERRWTGQGDYTHQDPAVLDRWQGWSQAAYEEAQLVETRPAREEADVRAEVEVFKVTRATFPSDPSWFAIFVAAGAVLPAVAEQDVHMRTTYKNFDGDTLLTVENTERTTHWIELFLVVLMPFDYPRAVERDVYLDLNRSAIAAAHERGIF